jgi:predicted  nucleic acid-binding Zn-ribbon protein
VRKTSGMIAAKKTDTQKAKGRGAGNTRGDACGACFVAKTQQQ